MRAVRRWIPSAPEVIWALGMTMILAGMWAFDNIRYVRVLVGVERVSTGLDLRMTKNVSTEQEMAFWFVCRIRNESCVAVSKREYLTLDEASMVPRCMHVTLESPPPDGWYYRYPENATDDYIPILVTSLDLRLERNWYGKAYISAEADIKVVFRSRFRWRVTRWIWLCGHWVTEKLVWNAFKIGVSGRLFADDWEVLALYFLVPILPELLMVLCLSIAAIVFMLWCVWC